MLLPSGVLALPKRTGVITSLAEDFEHTLQMQRAGTAGHSSRLG